MSSPVLIFLHMMKVGGTTLNSILLNNCPRNKSWIFSTYDPENEREGIRKLNGSRPEELLLVTGQMGFGAHRYLASSQYSTILRDPLKRAESYYNHFCRIPVNVKKQLGGVDTDIPVEELAQMTLAELLDNKISNQIDNGYVRYFAGDYCLPLSISDKPNLDEDDLKRAKENLKNHFPVIGVSEQFNKFLILLKEFTCISNILYTNKNETKKSDKKPLNDTDLNAIRKHNTLDSELYLYALDLMERKFNDYNLGVNLSRFEEDLKSYQDNYVSAQDNKIEEMNQKLNSINPNNRIAVYSCGWHTQKMLELTNLPKLDIHCILDTYKDSESFEGYKVLNAKKIMEEKIDTVIISNFPHQETIKNYLRNDLSFNKEIVTFYTGEDALSFEEL